MMRKHLCLALFLCLLLYPLSGLNRLEAQDRLARTLARLGAGCGYDTLLALGSAILNRVPSASAQAVRWALGAHLPRASFADARARAAARALLAGERALGAGYACFSRESVPGALRSGAFYFPPP